jgi:regulator of sigma E protease
MFEFIGSVWWLIVALGLLVTFHEYGHYWVARRCGVKVLRFSVGFGKALWSRTGTDGTEYQVAAIPLGGYVKMLDEREGDVSAGERDQAFNTKPVGQRIAIVAAGPIFNLVFAVAAFWVMFMIGTPETRPVVGEVSGIAADAGMQPGDEIIAIDNKDTKTWSHAILALVTHSLDRDTISVRLEDENGRQRSISMDLAQLGDDFSEDRTLPSLGIKPWRLRQPALVGEVTPGSGAEQGGLRSGDLILSIAGEPVSDWTMVPALIQQHGSQGQVMSMEIERFGQQRSLQVAAQPVDGGLFSAPRYMLGIASPLPDARAQAQLDRVYTVLQYGPIEGLGAATAETWRLTTATLGLIGRMITGSASVKNVSGPIGIAQFANSSASAGLTSFLFFLGLISLSLGILNLLPIPILDGGHLMYYLIELVTGKPVSEQAQVAGQYVGLVALFGLMSLGIFNDILRLVG